MSANANPTTPTTTPPKPDEVYLLSSTLRDILADNQQIIPITGNASRSVLHTFDLSMPQFNLGVDDLITAIRVLGDNLIKLFHFTRSTIPWQEVALVYNVSGIYELFIRNRRDGYRMEVFSAECIRIISEKIRADVRRTDTNHLGNVLDALANFFDIGDGTISGAYSILVDSLVASNLLTTAPGYTRHVHFNSDWEYDAAGTLVRSINAIDVATKSNIVPIYGHQSTPFRTAGGEFSPPFTGGEFAGKFRFVMPTKVTQPYVLIGDIQSLHHLHLTMHAHLVYINRPWYTKLVDNIRGRVRKVRNQIRLWWNG